MIAIEGDWEATYLVCEHIADGISEVDVGSGWRITVIPNSLSVTKNLILISSTLLRLCSHLLNLGFKSTQRGWRSTIDWLVGWSIDQSISWKISDLWSCIISVIDIPTLSEWRWVVANCNKSTAEPQMNKPHVAGQSPRWGNSALLIWFLARLTLTTLTQ